MDCELQKIQYELIPHSEFVGLKQYDFEQTIFDLNSQIDILSSKADSLDYIVAVTSGIALLDILWGGEFDLAGGREIASDKVDGFVKKTAKMLGCENTDDMKSAVKFLEQKFPIPSDGNTPDFGGGLQHHLNIIAVT